MQQQRWSRLHPQEHSKKRASNMPTFAAQTMQIPPPTNHTWSERHRFLSTNSFGGASRGVNSSNVSSAKVNIIHQSSGSINIHGESPALQLAAYKCRTAMEKVKGNTTTQLHFEEFHRQNLKEATEQLISATKSVDLLAKSITDIRERRNLKDGKSSDAANACLQELHKAFLSLTQSLLNCLDPGKSVTQQQTASIATYPKKKGAPQDDPHIPELLLTLSYRAHQLSLPFHYPLYQRLAVVLAKQPHILTMRSRADWIWHIHQWSQKAWGREHHESNSNRSKFHDDVDVNWFRSSLSALADQQYWSDLGYLLRNILQPTYIHVPGNHQASKRRKKKKRNFKQHHDISAFEQQLNHAEDGEPKFLDEELVRDLLTTMDRQQIFATLWKNLRHPSVEEEDILEILLLLEASIWRIFKYNPNAASEAASLHTNKLKNDTKRLNPNEPPKASLRDAIEVLLQNTPEREESSDSWRNTLRPDDEELDAHEHHPTDADDAALSQILLDLSDLLDTAADLDEESDGEHSSADVLTLAATMLDLRRPRVTRDLEGTARRSGCNQVLAVSGHPNRASQPLSSEIAGPVDRVWDDDDDDDFAGMIYQRVPSYHDDIPDVMSQIYQHNGSRVVKYSIEFEDEIYNIFRHFDEEVDE
jgi:hypothetical protein